MKVYKIRLVGTDLFYQPVAGRWQGEKSNFAVNGKLYHKKPSLNNVGSKPYISDSLLRRFDIPYITDSRFKERQFYIRDPEFEIVTYKLVEEKE